VDWSAVVRGRTDTNYQIFPGDRICIGEDTPVGVDAFIAGFTNPLYKLLGLSYQATSAGLDAETQGRAYNARGVRSF
jgi:hypothetical protein